MTFKDAWEWVAEWLASLDGKQEDAGSNLDGAESNRISK